MLNGAVFQIATLYFRIFFPGQIFFMGLRSSIPWCQVTSAYFWNLCYCLVWVIVGQEKNAKKMHLALIPHCLFLKGGNEVILRTIHHSSGGPTTSLSLWFAASEAVSAQPEVLLSGWQWQTVPCGNSNMHCKAYTDLKVWQDFKLNSSKRK